MWVLSALAGAAVVWLWLGPFDHLSQRLRRGLILAGIAVFGLCLWVSIALHRSFEAAMQRNREDYRRSSELKNREIDRINREAAEQFR